jgi:hypothetical protein
VHRRASVSRWSFVPVTTTPHEAIAGLARDSGRCTSASILAWTEGVACVWTGLVASRYHISWSRSDSSPRRWEARTGSACRGHTLRSRSDSPMTMGGAQRQCQLLPHVTKPFGFAHDDRRRALAVPVADKPCGPFGLAAMRGDAHRQCQSPPHLAEPFLDSPEMMRGAH